MYLWDDLVEREFAAGLKLTSIAVAGGRNHQKT